MTANYRKKERCLCKMCRKIRSLNEDAVCYACTKVIVKRTAEHKEYERQLRLSRGLS